MIFLKKYSTIPNKFLDDFYKLFNYQSTDNQNKIVNGEDVIKWLKIRKYNLKYTLKHSYNICRETQVAPHPIPLEVMVLLPEIL